MPTATHEVIFPGGRWGFLVGTAIAMAAATVLYVANPTTTSFYPPCPLYALTDIACPGCGTSRGLHQLLHGNLLAAVDHNVLMVLALPVFGYAWISQGLRVLGRPALPALPLSRRNILTIFAVILFFAVLRNIPVAPLTFLAP